MAYAGQKRKAVDETPVAWKEEAAKDPNKRPKLCAREDTGGHKSKLQALLGEGNTQENNLK